jgi:hypothetical protein
LEGLKVDECIPPLNGRWVFRMGEAGVDVKTLEFWAYWRFKEDGRGPRLGEYWGGEDERRKGGPRAPRFSPPLLKPSLTMEGVMVGGKRLITVAKRDDGESPCGLLWRGLTVNSLGC